MTINWDIARRVMLTQTNTFPENAEASRENCMHIMVSPAKLQLVQICIKGFYLALKCADQFGVRGGYAGTRNFQQVFQLEDEHILGIFDDRNPVIKNAKVPSPSSLDKLIDLYYNKQSNFKTLLVLEKSNMRLASSEVQGRQSKFLIDILYPALEGLRARTIENYDCHHWHKFLQAALCQAECREVSDGCNQIPDKLKHYGLLAAIYKKPDQVDSFLFEHSKLHSPLRYFCSHKSPFNLESSAG